MMFETAPLLLSRCRARNDVWQLFAQHAPAALKRLRGDYAEDALHEAGIALVERTEAGMPIPKNIGGWLVTMARWKLWTRARQLRREAWIEFDDYADKDGEERDPTCRPAVLPLSQWLFPALHDEVIRHHMLPSVRAAYILVALRGLSQDEAATILGVSQMTISRRLEAARNLLKEAL